MRSGVSAGLSANEAFRRYQAAAQEASQETGEHWTASNRSVFLQMYSSTRAARSQIGEAMQSPKNLPGGGLTPVPRETVRASGFGNWAIVFARGIGQTEVERLFYFQRSNQPLTPQEIENLAREDFENSAADEHGSMFRNVIEGVVFTGVEELIPTAGV